MDLFGEKLAEKVRTSLPGSLVYWEKDTTETGLDGAVLTAEYRKRKFTVQFTRDGETSPAEVLDDEFIEQVVDDFLDFFSRTIYPKEKFTRII